MSYCFDTAVFDDADFDVAAFIGSITKTAPLPTLRADLAAFLSELRSKVVDAINQDFDQTLKMSSKLEDADPMINELIRPLSTMKQHVQNVEDAVSASLGKVEVKMASKKSLQEKRKRLELCIQVDDNVELLDFLLLSADREVDPVRLEEKRPKDMRRPTNTSGTRSKIEVCATLERIANALTSTRSDIENGGDMKFLKNLGSRVSKIELELEDKLQKAFSQEIVPDLLYQRGKQHSMDKQVLASCLRAYSHVDRAGDAEKLFALKVVKPFVEQNITKGKLAGTGGRGSCQGLVSMFESIGDFIRSQCSDLLQVSQEDECAVFDFLGNSIWKMIESELVSPSGLGSIFSPGIPHIFHANYLASARLLDTLATEFCYTPTARRKFLNCTATKRFIGKWGEFLPVYFQLRFDETVTSVEKVMRPATKATKGRSEESSKESSKEGSAGAPAAAAAESKEAVPTTPDPDGNFLLKPSTHVWQCIEQCWGEDVFIPSLAQSFFKLTLQLVKAYGAWAARQKEQVWAAGAAGAEGGSAGQRQMVSADLAVALLADLATFEDKLLMNAASFIPAKISKSGLLLGGEAVAGEQDSSSGSSGSGSSSGSSSRAVSELVDKTLTNAARGSGPSSLAKVGATYWTGLAEHLSTQMIDGLQALKSIATTYRMMNKPPPTKASVFVPALLKPLVDFCGVWGETFSAGSFAEWKLGVCNR
jgi:hypothetical protein